MKPAAGAGKRERKQLFDYADERAGQRGSGAARAADGAAGRPALKTAYAFGFAAASW